MLSSKETETNQHKTVNRKDSISPFGKMNEKRPMARIIRVKILNIMNTERIPDDPDKGNRSLTKKKNQVGLRVLLP